MLIKTEFFIIVFIKLLFVVKIDEIASCGLKIWGVDKCCKYNFWPKCPGAFKPNCNIYNCVGCEYTYMLTRGCRLEYVQCSCYYCCEPKYAESCPNGCHNCLLDGPGGCISRFKSIGNSSSSLMLESEGNARKNFDMVEFFIIVFIKLLFLVKIDEIASCKLEIWDDDGCCTYVFWKPSTCPGAFKPNCNVFDRNCVGCRYSYSKKTGCRPYVECSCYYCCDPKYAESCPNGCEQCIRDGKGGCHGKFKSIGNSSSSMREPEGNAREGFDMVDVDKNGSISLNEAIAYLGSKENGTLPKHFAKNMSWFADIDLNGNNQIEPGEFDRSLIGVDDQTSG